MSDKEEVKYSMETVSQLTPAVIFDGNTIESVVEAIEKEVRAEVPDISTAKGRDRIKSIAAKVASSKVALDNMGKALVTDWKAKAKLVDADRKLARDRLDALKIEIRKPVTEWEEKAARRIEALEERVAVIAELGKSQNEDGIMYPLAALKERLGDLEAIAVDDSFEEFKLDAMETKEAAMNALKVRIHELEEQAAKEAEIQRLQAEKEEKERQDREAEIARKAAEEAAAAERERVKAEAEAAENARLAAIKEKEEAEQRLIDQQKQAEADALAAEQAAKDAAAQAEREKQEAIDRERIRQEEQQKREQEEVKRREADKEHKRKLNNEALECFKRGGLDNAAAKIAVELIAKKMIANVTINY